MSAPTTFHVDPEKEIRRLKEKIEHHTHEALAVRVAWDEWLKDDEQEFPSDEFLDAVDTLCTTCGVEMLEEAE